jgi:hypothetical protein
MPMANAVLMLTRPAKRVKMKRDLRKKINGQKE